MATVVGTPSNARLGAIAPGWSAKFQATPTDIGDSAASTGAVSFNSQTLTETVYSLDDDNTITREGLGQITGVVDGLTLNKLDTSVTQGTVLTRLNVDAKEGALLGGTQTARQHIEQAIRHVLPSVPIAWKATSNPTKTYPYWAGNVWANINDMCIITHHELVVENDTIAIYDVGSRKYTFPEFSTAGVEISIDSSSTAAEFSVVNQRAKQITNGELYNAFDEANTMFQVSARDTVLYSVVSNSYPSSMNKPSCVTKVYPNITMSPGTYAVSASDGRAVPADLWVAFGGDVSVARGEAPNVIDVTIKGPKWLIPNYEPPYRLTVSNSVEEFAAFSIRGTGILTNPEEIPMQTGADLTKISGAKAPKIDSLFVSDLAAAYDRGAALGDTLAGPTMTLTATIPVQYTTGFSTTVGALFTYSDQTYRITDSTTSNDKVTLTATRFTTCGEMDAAWAGKTAGQHATFWLGHNVGEVTTTPLRT